MIEIFILSLVQGITEFLPISSSSHLIIISKYFNFENQNLSIDVSLHIGSFLAVIVYFRSYIKDFFKNKQLFLKIFVASIPVMTVGYCLVKFQLIEHLRNIKIIGWTTVIFGILLYLSDKTKYSKKINFDLNYKSIVLIGFFQILSLIPGVSRSGISITGARFLKFDRLDSAKISFLLSIPTLAAVSIFGINNILKSEVLELSILNLTSIVLSFIFSLTAIKYFLKYIKNSSLTVFAIYRVILGFIILLFSYL